MDKTNKQDQSRKPLMVFYLVAFIVPWIGWSIMAVTSFNMFLFYTSYACSLVGITAILLENGKAGLFLMAKKIEFKAPLPAWLLAVIFPFVWQAMSFILFGFFFNQKGLESIQPANISNLFSWHILWLLTTGPLSEEFGWRGYLLPKFLTKYNFISSNFILGLIWAFWHLPLMYQKWSEMPVSSLYFFIGVICFAMIIGIIYILSKGNLLLCIVSHWTINATQEMFGSMFPNTDLSNQSFHIFSVAILVLLTSILLYLFRKDIKLANQSAFSIDPNQQI